LPSAVGHDDGPIVSHQRHRHLGHHVPIGWGFAIVNFGRWIRIGHAHADLSDLISVKSKGRTSINRFAEAMTLFA